jgi:hypothetical protein
MEIRIAFRALEPPQGCATGDDRNAVRFTGWLELIRSLEGFVERQKRSEADLSPDQQTEEASR